MVFAPPPSAASASSRERLTAVSLSAMVRTASETASPGSELDPVTVRVLSDAESVLAAGVILKTPEAR